MLRPAAAIVSALLVSACVTTGMAPIVPASPAGGPAVDPGVFSYLQNGTWRATKDPSSNTACTEHAVPSFSFVRHKGRLQIVRIDNGKLMLALFTVFVSVFVDPTEFIESARSDGQTLDVRSTKGTGKSQDVFTLRFAPTGPDTMSLVGATASIVRDGVRHDKADTSVTHYRRCPDDPEPAQQKKRS